MIKPAETIFSAKHTRLFLTAKSDGRRANGYGLYNMAGNLWQGWNDWYDRNCYRHSAGNNPPGPASFTPMPDGKPYRVLRGGNW